MCNALCITSSLLMSSLEKVSPGIKPLFFSQNMAAKDPEKKIPSTAAKATTLSPVEYNTLVVRHGPDVLFVATKTCRQQITLIIPINTSLQCSHIHTTQGNRKNSQCLFEATPGQSNISPKSIFLLCIQVTLPNTATTTEE